jgi:SAM-dependent methyltransferase
MSVMKPPAEILQCPETEGPLHWTSDEELSSVDGQPRYKLLNGVACRLTKEAAEGDLDPSASVREFYESEGWEQDEHGQFKDTKAYVDTRATSLSFTRRCISRLGKHFKIGGRYLLDAGSGAIPHDELLSFGARFEHRVCVDLSAPALWAAQTKVGAQGIYLQGDLTKLPIKTGTMDAVTCNHVVYLIPAEHQAEAFMELWRVLKPGGVAVVVYWWPYAPLALRMERLASRFISRGAAEAALENYPTMYHYYHSRAWFESQSWPFRYEFDIYRVIDNAFLRNFVSDDWRGRIFLNLLYALQVIAPRFCGRHGVMPAIIIHKD